MRTDSSPRRDASTLALAAGCLFAALFVFLPFHAYLANKTEFLVAARDLLAYGVATTAAFTLIAWLALLALPAGHRGSRLAAAPLLALSLLLWVQGVLLVWPYGPLDGSDIAWDKLWIYGAIDGSIWLVVLALALAKSRPLYRSARSAALALTLLQLLSVGLTAFQTRNVPGPQLEYSVDDARRFEFSKNKNVLLLVLDEFQSDIFLEIVTEDPTYAAIFDGFTYFPDALAPSNFTETAVPAILTGRLYDNSVPRGEYLRSAFLADSLPKVLKDEGFEVDLFPWLGWANDSVYLDERVVTNLRLAQPGANVGELLRLLDFSLFKALPHSLKRHIYNEHAWWLSAYFAAGQHPDQEAGIRLVEPRQPTFWGLEFMRAAERRSQFEIESPVFKFYHLEGMHVSLTTNEAFEVRRRGYSRSSYTGQAKAVLRVCESFLDILKRNGAYDRSLIAIVADHGSGRSKGMYVNPAGTRHEALLSQRATTGDFQQDKARGIALVLVKRFNARGPMQISHVPVTLIDLPKTILSELEIPVPLPGESMFELGTDEGRERHYGAYRWAPEESDFVAPMTMYVVAGPSWSSESWRIVGVRRADQERDGSASP